MVHCAIYLCLGEDVTSFNVEFVPKKILPQHKLVRQYNNSLTRELAYVMLSHMRIAPGYHAQLID